MKDKKNPRVRPGFSMVELMAVLIILGLLFALVAGNVMGKVDGARITTTKANLKSLHNAVKSFRMDCTRYPTEDEGLLALIDQPMDIDTYPEEGYLDTTELPVDAWNNDFVFELYPESGKPFVIRSLGPDKEYDTEDDLLSTDAH
jgi:general secretion pathway protein G